MNDTTDFLPVSQEDMHRRGWWWNDFLLVTGDAYVDHPSFGPAVIGRVLEAEGCRVAILAQPDWHSAAAFAAMGRPRYGVMIGAGNLDSMVAHYTAAKKHRSEDFYSPGKKAGLRPDRATIVYANRAREAFPGLPMVIGGLEASLRRFAHYDYWEDKVRRCILVDSGADILALNLPLRCRANPAGSRQRQLVMVLQVLSEPPTTLGDVSDRMDIEGLTCVCILICPCGLCCTCRG